MEQGVYYVGHLVAVKVSERNGYTNGDLVIIREGATETDKISTKPGSDVEEAARALPPGEEVLVKVIPARKAISKSGSMYVRPPYALQVSAQA